MVGRFESENQRRTPAIAHARKGDFACIEQATVRGLQPGPRKGAHAGRGRHHVVGCDRGRGSERGPALQPHPGLRDNAHRAFGADDQPVRRKAGTRARQLPRLDRAGRREHARALDEVVDVRRLRGVVAAGARRDPAAQRAELKALREVPQGHAVGAQFRFEIGAEDAGLDQRCTARGVDLEHLVQVLEIEREGGAVVAADIGFHATHHAGTAAERHHCDVVAAGPVEHDRSVGFGARERHPVGRIRNIAHPHAGDIAKALAVAVRDAVVRYRGHQRSQRVGTLARRRERIVDQLRLGQCGACGPESREHRMRALALGFGKAVAQIPPAPEAAGRLSGERYIAHHASSPRFGGFTMTRIMVRLLRVVRCIGRAACASMDGSWFSAIVEMRFPLDHAPMCQKLDPTRQRPGIAQ